jgi:hypothetical protein
MFSRSEESISISQVASVKISTGIIWSDIVIESTGGICKADWLTLKHDQMFEATR